MYNHNKAQQSKNRVHIFWDILYIYGDESPKYGQKDIKFHRLAPLPFSVLSQAINSSEKVHLLIQSNTATLS